MLRSWALCALACSAAALSSTRVLTSLASHHYPSSMQEHDIHASNKQGPEVLPPIATTP